MRGRREGGADTQRRWAERGGSNHRGDWFWLVKGKREESITRGVGLGGVQVRRWLGRCSSAALAWAVFKCGVGLGRVRVRRWLGRCSSAALAWEVFKCGVGLGGVRVRRWLGRCSSAALAWEVFECGVGLGVAAASSVGCLGLIGRWVFVSWPNRALVCAGRVRAPAAQRAHPKMAAPP
jgi:hypothetical protein